MKRFLTICKIEFLLFLRDFFGCFFTLIFPVIMLLIFGGIYGNEPLDPGAALGMIDVCVPAYSVMVMGVTGLMALPLTLSECKEKKIYKRFDATPAGKKSILAAQVSIDLVMTLLGILLLLAAGRLLYQIQIQGSPFTIGVAILLSTAVLFSMGFLFTAIGRDAKSTSLLCYLFYFVMLFLSGATIPDQLFPDSMKTVARFLPMTYAVDLMQGVFAGDSLGQHGGEMLLLGLLTILFTLVGAVLYSKKDWS